MSPPLPISVFHYTLCIVGSLVNIALLGIIVRKTPRNLRSYSILLFSQTLLQTSTCIASGVLFVRLIPSGVLIFFVISGPASYSGSYQICYYLYSVMLHGHAHYIIMLAVCFTYRYYVILNSSPKFHNVLMLVTLIYLPTPIIFYWFSQTPLFNDATAKRLLISKGPSYVFGNNDMVTGIANVLLPSAITGIVWVCAPCLPAYTLILIVGRKMLRVLAANVAHMSERTRASHKEIVRGLVFQACLPALYTFSSGTYVIGQLNLLNIVALEYVTHIAGEICVTASPFMTLYFVQPYRRTIRRVVSNRDTTVTVSVVPSASFR